MSQNTTKFIRCCYFKLTTCFGPNCYENRQHCYHPQITTTDFLQALKLRLSERRRNFQTNVSTYPINLNYITCVY